MRAYVFSCVLIVFSILNASLLIAEDVAELLSLKIIPKDKDKTKDEFNEDRYSIDVVLTNNSDGNLFIWKEWCSWGYFCMEFEIIDQEGKAFRVKKRSRGWKANVPDPLEVKKGGEFVYTIQFDEIWIGFPKDWTNQKIKIKAIFEIKKDDHTDSHKVWVGKVESKEIEIDIFKLQAIEVAGKLSKVTSSKDLPPR